MNNRPQFKDGKVYLPVFSFTDGAGEAFFNTLGLDPNEIGSLPMGEHTVEIELFRVTDTTEGLDLILNKADACLLLLRFLDQITMNQVKEAFRLIGSESFMPKTVASFREAKETEFKISCTYCGQKLWVRDRDAGRRGNCPKCHKTFFIPTQKAFITSYLMLNETVPVITVVDGDASCRNAVTSLVERIFSMEEGLKSSTIRIEIPQE